MQAVTVTGGPIQASYDVVLAHEHLLIDLSWSLSDNSALVDATMTLELAKKLSHNPRGCRDNLVLDDRRLAVEEISPLREIRALIVEVTPNSMARDPKGLAEISVASGVDIVMGGGLCILPPDREALELTSPEEWKRSILAQLDYSTGPRQSVIGEVGTSDPITQAQRNSLIGSVLAQRERHLPMYVYLDPFGRRGHESSLSSRNTAVIARGQCFATSMPRFRPVLPTIENCWSGAV